MSRIGRRAATLCSIYFLLGLSVCFAAQKGKILYSFTCHRDGSLPSGGVILDKDENLYGTTFGGGAHGWGTVFKLSRSGSGWVETVIHNFGAGTDGVFPEASVVMGADGSLYGTTVEGGTYSGCGTVFKLTPQSSGKWKESVIHNFNFTTGDGCRPEGALTFDKEGNLYGTTEGGGTNGYGIVFKLSPSSDGWQETILHSFNRFTDGVFPMSSLTLDSDGNLYGTTPLGGIDTDYGTVFQLKPSVSGWQEELLHSFKNPAEGTFVSNSVVLDKEGNVYGTTTEGAVNKGGTAFRLSRRGEGWDFATLHEFAEPSEGQSPGVLAFDSMGNLYGETGVGGNLEACYPYGCGTIFKLTPSRGDWADSVVYEFSKGQAPAGLTLAGDHIFSTMIYGGKYGCGNIFEVEPR